MAVKLPFNYTPGLTTLYAQIITPAGNIFNRVTPGFEVPANTPAVYNNAVTESGLPGLYFLTWPASIAAGYYSLVVRNRAGGGPLQSDSIIGAGDLFYDGANVLIPASSVTTDKLATMLTPSGPNYKFTPDALSAAPSVAPRPHAIIIEAPASQKALVTLRTGNNNIVLQETLRYGDGTIIDLNSKTVAFQLIPAAGGANVATGTASIADATVGRAQYIFVAADLVTPGSYYRKWIITDAGGGIQTYDEAVNLPVVIQP